VVKYINKRVVLEDAEPAIKIALPVKHMASVGGQKQLIDLKRR